MYYIIVAVSTKDKFFEQLKNIESTGLEQDTSGEGFYYIVDSLMNAKDVRLLQETDEEE